MSVVGGDSGGNLFAATHPRKANARFATTANITLSAAQTVDGVAAVADDIGLVKNQSTGAENGLYIVASGAWVRTGNMPAGGDASGFLVYVTEGTANADTGFACTDDEGSAVVATDALTFASTGTAGVAGGAFTADGDTQITATTAILLDQATGNEVALTLNYTTNKAAGDDTGLRINQTDTASPGTSLLFDAQVGGTSKFVIDNTGKVGLGITVPTNLMHLVGSNEIENLRLDPSGPGSSFILLQVNNSGAGNNATLNIKGVNSSTSNFDSDNSKGKIFASSTDWKIGTTSNHPMVFLTNNNERMRLTGGDLGIGLTPSGAKLGIGDSFTSGGTDDRTLDLSTTLNDAGAAGGSDVFRLIKGNITETDITGWDTVKLIDLQVGGSTLFEVNNTGEVSIGGVTPVAGTKLLLPQENDAATPTLAFGDGDTGFYESSDDILRISIQGTNRFSFTFAGEFRSANANGPTILDEQASSTNPTFVPNVTDNDTGIGWATADQLSLIAGGVEQARFQINGNQVINSLLNEATGDEVALSLNYTVNKATSGADTGLRINQTDTASPGTSLLVDFQQGGTSRFAVNAGGNVGIGTAIPVGLFSIATSNGQQTTSQFASTELTSMTGASVTASSLIPAGSFIIGVTIRVTTTITGATSFDIGDGVAVDRWGAGIALAAGTTTTTVDFTAAGFGQFATANDVVLTANVANFTAGAVRITVHYISLTAATS